MIFRLLSFILITIFYIAYFAKQILLHRKGIVVNQMARGVKPNRTAVIETFLLTFTYLTAAIQYASIFLSKQMMVIEFLNIIRWIGILMIACGVLFFILAITVMRDSWRAGVDQTQNTSIVTTGIYKISRNPAFVGFDLLYIGTALAMPNIFIIVAAIISIALMHLQVLEEEKYLPSVFGEEYLQYKEKTRRYL